MEPLSASLIQGEWQKESADLYPAGAPNSVVARAHAPLQEFLATAPERVLAGIRRSREHFPALFQLLGYEWALEPSAYCNAVEPEYQARVFGMAAAQYLIATRSASQPVVPEEVREAASIPRVAERFKGLVIRSPPTMRVDLVSPRVLGRGEIGFVVVPIYYHAVCEGFSRQLIARAAASADYGENPLGVLVSPARSSAAWRAPPELIVATVGAMAGDIDRADADEVTDAVATFAAAAAVPAEAAADDFSHVLTAALTDFSIAHEIGHWWAQHKQARDPSHEAAQEAVAHQSAVSLLVGFHHFFRDTGLVDAMVKAALSPVVAPLLIQVLHVCLLRYLAAVSGAIVARLYEATGEPRLAGRLKRLTEAHRRDLLHFMLMLDDLKKLVYADSADWTASMRATVDANIRTVLEFQRRTFEEVRDIAGPSGPITDAQLVELYRALLRLVPKSPLGI